MGCVTWRLSDQEDVPKGLGQKKLLGYCGQVPVTHEREGQLTLIDDDLFHNECFIVS